MVGGDESLWHAANSPQVGPTGVCLAAPMLRSLWCLTAHSFRRRALRALRLVCSYSAALGAGSVPVLGVLCACRTRPAIRCGIFHQVRRSASPGNQPLWFSGARQRWPWAAPVLGRLLAWPSRRVVIHNPQPLRRSVAIWYSSSAHGARLTCPIALYCLALDDLLSLDPRCSASPTLRTLLLSLTCLCV